MSAMGKTKTVGMSGKTKWNPPVPPVTPTKKNNNSFAHVQKVRQLTIKLQQTKIPGSSCHRVQRKVNLPNAAKRQHICDLAKTHNTIQCNP